MTNALAGYLDKEVSALLELPPFNAWAVERSEEKDLPEPIVHYVFPGRGVELRCDRREKISAIFVDSDEWIECGIADIRLATGRSEVVEKLGMPSKSGAGFRDPILGNYGAWDRFSKAGYAVHVEYRADMDRIKRITWIRGDVVP